MAVFQEVTPGASGIQIEIDTTGASQDSLVVPTLGAIGNSVGAPDDPLTKKFGNLNSGGGIMPGILWKNPA